MSTEQTDHFSLWESEIQKTESRSHESNIEKILFGSNNPIEAAIQLADYTNRYLPDSHESVIKECIEKLNYHYMGRYITEITVVTVNGRFGHPGVNESDDMADLLIELKHSEITQVGGRLGFFEKHYFEDQATGNKYPAICLRMYDAVYIKKPYQSSDYNSESYTVPIQNYVTLPVQNIEDYRIHEEE